MEKKNAVKEYAVITVGIFLASSAIYFFMIPAGIVMGSITGLAVILVNLVPVSVSVMTFILNVICLVIGFVLVGKEFGAKTVYVSVLMPGFMFVFEKLFPNIQSLTGDVLLDMICLIILVSLGQVLLFRSNASSGGLDIIAKVLNKYLHMEIGQGLVIAGVVIVLCSALVYDARTSIIGMLATYFNGLVVDEYTSGFTKKKKVCIMSEHFERLQHYIIHEIGRGVTCYPVVGGYSGEARTEIVTILNKNEYGKLMNHIQELDPMAFVTVSTVSEVIGRWNRRSR